MINSCVNPEKFKKEIVDKKDVDQLIQHVGENKSNENWKLQFHKGETMTSAKEKQVHMEIQDESYKPWFQEQFSRTTNKETITIYGITLDKISFDSTLPHQCIDNCAIDSFQSYLASEFNDIKL